jgi:hypothetical protein
LGSFNTFFDLLFLAACLFYLSGYFRFFGYDLNKFRPASTVSVAWNMILAVAFPLVGLQYKFANTKINKTLVAIGMSTILIPAILPELEPPEPRSTLEWIYVRTIGKLVADFLGGCLINFILIVCWMFGSLWVAAYAALAALLGLGRTFWVLLHGPPDRREAAPRLRRLLMIFAAAFGWVTFLAFQTQVAIDRKEVQQGLDELFKVIVVSATVSWLSARFPRAVPLLRFLAKD